MSWGTDGQTEKPQHSPGYRAPKHLCCVLQHLPEGAGRTGTAGTALWHSTRAANADGWGSLRNPTFILCNCTPLIIACAGGLAGSAF